MNYDILSHLAAETALKHDQEALVKLSIQRAELLKACKESYNYLMVLREIYKPVGMNQMIDILVQAITEADNAS